jgi:hypothetical protein
LFHFVLGVISLALIGVDVREVQSVGTTLDELEEVERRCRSYLESSADC